MPNPADVRVSITLTNFARDKRWNEQLPWVAPTVAPFEGVASTTGTYKTYGDEMLYDDVSDEKSNTGETNEIGYEISEGTFTTLKYAFKTFVSYEEIALWKHPETAKKRAVRFCQNRLLLKLERRMHAIATATSYNATPSYDWDHASATPVDDIAAAKAAFKTNNGLPADTFVIGDHILEELALADQIQGIAKYQNFFNMLKVTGANFAAQSPFGLQWVIADKMYRSSVRGAATAVNAHVWGDDAYLCRSGSQEQLDAPWCRIFRFSPWMVFEWEDKDRGGFYEKVLTNYQIKEVTDTAIYKLVDVT